MSPKETPYSRHAPLLGTLMFLLPTAALTTAMMIGFLGGPGVALWLFTLVGCILFVTTTRYNMRWRQYHWFYRSFRTYGRFRAENIDEARQVWQQSGEKGIKRHLKFVYPLLPKEHRLRLTEELRAGQLPPVLENGQFVRRFP